MRTLLSIALGALLTHPLLAPPALAGDGGAGEVAVGMVTTSTDGDQSKFREDSRGERSNLVLDLLHWRRDSAAATLTLDGRFSSGGDGWLDLRLVGDRWNGGFNLTAITDWSNDSFAADRLPSGAAVSDLYPGTVALDPLFGVELPHRKTLAGEAWASYRLAGSDRITVRAGTRSRDGERVPNVGGFSFSDLGTAAFTTAGLETVDATASWLGVEGRFSPGRFKVRASLGLRDLATDRTVRLPAYGADRLLDLNAWSDGADTRVTTGALDVRWDSCCLALFGGLAWTDTGRDPRGGDRRETPGGTIVRGGLGLAGGSVNSNAFAAALGTSFSPAPWVSLTLALDTREADGEGDVDLILRSVSLAPTRATFDESRLGGTVIAAVHQGKLAARLRARGVSTELKRQEQRDAFRQDTTRTTDRRDVRLDASYRISPQWQLSGWARSQLTDAKVDLAALWAGYATSNWKSSTDSAAMALTYRSGDGFRFSLAAAQANTDFKLESPFFDPIFDPSIDLVPTIAASSLKRFTGSFVTPLTQGSVWGEVGWLTIDYNLDEFAVPTGLLPLSEKIGGLVTVLGGETTAWKGSHLSGQVEWIQNRNDLDSELLRAYLRLDQELTPRLSLFARLGQWQLDNAAAAADEYTVSVFAGGVRASF